MLRVVQPSYLKTTVPGGAVAGKETISRTLNEPLLEARQKLEPVPATDKTKFYGPESGQYSVYPSPMARYLNLPKFLGGGQYTTDPSQTNKLIKTARSFSNEEIARIRGGLLRNVSEVEHIAPLWAGGTNNLNNIQLMSPDVHSQKSKVESVAKILYYAGEISLPEARVLASSWQNRDVNGVNMDANGDIDLQTAREKHEEWKGVKLVSAGELWQSLWKNIKKLPQMAEATIGGAATAAAAGVADIFAPGDRYKAIQEGIKYGKKVMEGKEGLTSGPILGEFSKGVVEGISGGWIPQEQTDFQSNVERGMAKTSRIAGNLAGTLANFATLQGLVTKAATKVGLTTLFKGSKLGQILTDPKAVISPLGFTVKTNKVGRILGDMGLFGLQGLTTKHEEATFSNYMEQLLHDVSLGTVMGVSQGLKAWRSYALMGGGAYTLSRMAGDSEEDALLNSTILMGLHGLGRYSGSMKARDAASNRAATIEAINFYRRYGVDTPIIGEGWTTANKQNLSKLLTDVKGKITGKFVDGKLSVDQVNEEYKKALIAARQIYKGGLAKEERIVEELKDLKSLFDRQKRESVTPTERPMPDVIYDFKETFPQETNKVKGGKLISTGEVKLDFEPTKETKVSPEDIAKHSAAPQGRIFVTGLAESVDPQTAANVKAYGRAMREENGMAGTKVWLSLDETPATVGAVKGANEVMERDYKAELERGEKKLYDKPENNVRIVGMIGGEEVSGGFVPTEFRITKQDSGINRTVTEYGYRPFDPTLNNNAVAEYMRNNNIKFLPAEIEVIGALPFKDASKETPIIRTISKASNEPYMIIKVTPKDWAEGSAKTRIIEAKKQSLATGYLRKKTTESLSSIVADKVAPESAKTIVSRTLKEFEEPISRGDTKEFQKRVNDLLGPVLTEDAMKIIGKNPTLGELVRWIEYAKNTGRLSPSGETFYNFLNRFIEGGRLRADDPIWSKPLAPAKQLALPEPKKVKEIVKPGQKTAEEIKKVLKPIAEKAKTIVENNGTTEKFGEFSNVKIKKVPESQIRNEQIGDYKKTSDGGIEILVSDKLDDVEAKQVAIHELVESNLAEKRGIPFKDIDKFDKEHIKSPEPGALKSAPYHEEHLIANEAEKLIVTPPLKVKMESAESKAIKEIDEKVATPKEPETLESQTRPGLDEEIKATTQAEQVFEDTSPDIMPLKKWGEYQEGINSGASTMISKKQIALEESGNFSEAKRLEEIKQKLTRPIMAAKARILAEKNPNNFQGAFEQFQNDLSENIFVKNGMSNPFTNKKASQILKNHFIRLVYGGPRKAIAFDPMGRATVRIDKEMEIKSPMDLSMEKYNKENGKNLDTVYLDAKNSNYFLTSAYDPRARMEKLNKAMFKEGYVLIGPSGNKPETIFAIKYDKDLVTKFKERPDDYLMPGEVIPKSDADKFIRAFLVDVQGMQKNMYAKDLLKRSKIFNDHGNPNVIPEINWRHFILPDEPVGDLIDVNRIGKDVTPEAIESLKAKPRVAGKIYMSKEAIQEIAESQGNIGRRLGLKPGVLYNYKLPDGQTSTFMQKGDIIAYDRRLQKKFEKQLGKHLGKWDVITFADNIKSGLDNLAVTGGPTGTLYREIDIPSSSYRFKYYNVGKPRATFNLSILGKFGNNPEISKAVKDWYQPHFDKFIEFENAVKNSTNGRELSAIFKKYYNRDLPKTLYGRYTDMILKGAGKHSLSKQVDEALSKIFKEEVLSANFAPGARLKITPDQGYIKDGKLTYLKPDEIMISRRMAKEIGNPSYIVSLRYPVTHVQGMTKMKVLIAEDYNVHNLGRENSIISYHDMYGNKYGDTDADDIHIFSVGVENGFPKILADTIEKERAEFGEIVLPPAIEQKYGKEPPTQENLMKIGSSAILGGDVVGITSATTRIMPTLVANKMRVEVSGSNGKNTREYKIWFGKYLHEEGTFPADGKKYEPSTIVPKWDRDAVKLGIEINNAATDAISSAALSGLNWDNSLLLREFFNTKDQTVLKLINKVVGGLSDKNENISRTGFQIPFQTALKSRTPVNNENLVENIKKYNKFSGDIQSGGGQMTPIQELMSNLNKLEGFKKLSPSENIVADTLGGQTLTKKVGAKIKFTPKATDFINFAKLRVNKSAELYKEEMKKFGGRRLTQNENFILKQKIGNQKATWRQEIIDYFKNNFRSYKKEDLDDISYWTITSDDANTAKPQSGRAKTLVYRLDELFTPEQARIYYDTYEGYKP